MKERERKGEGAEEMRDKRRETAVRRYVAHWFRIGWEAKEVGQGSF